MYEAIATLLEERIVTAEDFAPFVGQRTAATIDFDGQEMIARIEIRQPLILSGNVLIRVMDDWTDGCKTGEARTIDADELAIRIEDA